MMGVGVTVGVGTGVGVAGRGVEVGRGVTVGVGRSGVAVFSSTATSGGGVASERQPVINDSDNSPLRNQRQQLVENLSCRFFV